MRYACWSGGTARSPDGAAATVRCSFALICPGGGGRRIWTANLATNCLLVISFPVSDTTGSPHTQTEDKDVDGPGSLPLKIDGEVPNLGKLHAPRRVVRAICLGSARTTAAAHRGLESRWVKLSCVMPGEPLAVFGGLLRRLAAEQAKP